MTNEQREQAARQLGRVLKLIEGVQMAGAQLSDDEENMADAYRTAIAALREQGWMRTSERLPDHGMVAAKSKDYDIIQFLRWDVIEADWVELWFQMPTLPVDWPQVVSE